MTIGEKLQELRKRETLSQEALAEKLGVSRQAVSKWESGAAIPTIDNLIELSRLFSVSVDELLCAPATDTQKTDTLSAAAVGRLLDEYSARQAHKRRRYIIYCGAALALLLVLAAVVVIGLNTRINRLKQDINNVSGSIEGISGNLNSQMNVFTAQLQEQLDAQESIITDYSRTFASFNAAAQTVTFTFSVTPKTQTQTMSAYIFALSDGAAGEKTQMTPNGAVYTAVLTLPGLANETRIMLSVEDGAETHNQLLETAYHIGNDYYMQTIASFSGTAQVTNDILKLSGQLVTRISPAYIEDYTSEYGETMVNWPLSGRAEVVRGDEVLYTVPLSDMSDMFDENGAVDQNGDFIRYSECNFYAALTGEYPADAEVRVVVKDNYGYEHTAWANINNTDSNP